MRFIFAALLVLLLGLFPVSAKEPDAATAQEIEQLFTALRGSGCTFQRNGRWHDAAEAARHLERKRDYLARRGLVTSTESLIELAASKSSLSGRPYRVKCPGADAVESREWLMRKLGTIRAR